MPFRRFRRRTTRTLREPIHWERGTSIVTSAAGAVGSAQLFIPDTLSPTTQLDINLTLRRMRLILNGFVSVASAVSNVLLLWMLYVRGQQDASDRDPQLLTDTDKHADLLDRGVMYMRANGASKVDELQRERDIRVMRTLDQNQSIAIVVKPINAATGALVVDGTYGIHVSFSNLFARTMRR